MQAHVRLDCNVWNMPSKRLLPMWITTLVIFLLTCGSLANPSGNGENFAVLLILVIGTPISSFQSLWLLYCWWAQYRDYARSITTLRTALLSALTVLAFPLVSIALFLIGLEPRAFQLWLRSA